MKVVWFTNVVVPEAAAALGLPPFHKAGWLEGYLAALRLVSGISLTTVARSGAVTEKRQVEVDGIRHIVLPTGSVKVAEPFGREVADEYCAVLRDVDPDVIHYHGSEFHFGLLSAEGFTKVPAVLSIQGLLGVYSRVYYGGLGFEELWKAHSLKENLRRSGIWGERRRFLQRAAVEDKILRSLKHVIGRTVWDRAHMRDINPEAHYHHCDELLRPEFHAAKRQRSGFKKFTIYAPTAWYPIKGFHFLLRAVAILRREFPEVLVRVADNKQLSAQAGAYPRLLRNMIEELGLSKNVEWLGPLDGASVARVLEETHVFVAPSVVENLCNSLAEAMLVGVPSVASFAGGMVTTIRHEETGLSFPIGDYAMLAECIRRLFLDDQLAARLVENARAVALVRHDVRAVGNSLKDIYVRVSQDGARKQ